MTLPRASLLLAVAATAWSLAGCAGEIGKRRPGQLDEAAELRLGEQEAAVIEAEIGLYDDPELTAYVQRVGGKVAAHSHRPRLAWHFAVLDSPVANAISLPGGWIYVTRGLLAVMDSEAELAVVLGHEIGHVAALHSIEQLRQAARREATPGTVENLTGSAVVGKQFYRNSRDNEFQADELALEYSAAAGYDPRAAAAAIDALETYDVAASNTGAVARIEDSLPSWERKQVVPAWMSTHPGTATRVDKLRAAAEGGKGRISRDEYLAEIDGIVYGEDPRKGTFLGSRFIHPNAGFRIDLPVGWKALNNDEAVIAFPASEDALVGCLPVDDPTLYDAERAFFATGVFVAGERREQASGGVHSIMVGFSGAGELSGVYGLAAFTQLDGRTRVILAIGRADQWDSTSQLVYATMSSLAPLRTVPPQAANPLRVRIETSGERRPVGDLVRFEIPEATAEVLAALNRVPPGAKVKGSIKVILREIAE